MQYALGNSAKAMIVEEILHEVGSEEATIFDFGCGDGRQWARALADHPNLSYVGYEPNAKRAREATTTLPERASIHTDAVPTAIDADYVVSFSVFEHVAEREPYIHSIERVLAADGVAYLNYDDGHFRNSLDLNDPRKWPQQFKAWVHAIVGPVFSALDDPSRYQKRVDSDQLRATIDETGLVVEDVHYNNIADLKGLFGNVPAESREEYTRLWVEFESELNELLGAVDGAETAGDDCVLWDVALSKTMVLRHEEAAT